jgi:hypothetical protein
MWRTALGGLVVVHGLLTAAMWLPKYKEVEGASIQPPNTSHSWLFGEARGLALTLGVTAALLLVIAGAAFLTQQTWWPTAGLIAGSVSLLLFALFFSPWWVIAFAISGGLVIAALRAGPVT